MTAQTCRHRCGLGTGTGTGQGHGQGHARGLLERSAARYFYNGSKTILCNSVVDPDPNTDPDGFDTFCLSGTEIIIPDPAGSEIKWNDKCPHRLSVKLNV
jgi:hypothetical protein